MTLVLFDVDGTLVDSQAAIHECMRRTFVEFGQTEPDIAAVRSIIGLSLDHAIDALLGGMQADIGAMSAFYKDNWLTVQALPEYEARFFDGMRELLDELASRDEVLLGLVTGKSRRGIARMIELHGLDTMFVATRTADDCPSKPHPAMVLECCAETGVGPDRTTVIGDTAFDMQMAIAAGADAIGVGWGYHPTEELIEAGAGAVAKRASEITGLLALATMD